MKKTMRGLVKETAGPGMLVYHDDLPIPEVGVDDVLMKIACTAICGTDVHIVGWDEWSRKRMHPPVITGHETAGVIAAVGKNVTNCKVGDRVACEPIIPCGECYFCKNDMPHLCKDVGVFGVKQDGAFAEYAVIRSNAIYVLDDDTSFEAACLIGPMGAGIHGVENAEVEGKTVLVSGCGPIGLTAISASKVFGAKQVIAYDLLDARLEIAKEMGADVVLNSSKVNVVEEVRKLTDGIGADCAVDVTGAEVAINTDLKALRAAGRLVCVGLPTKPVTLTDMADDLIYREVELTGIVGRRIWGTWENFAKVAKSPYYKLDQMIGGRYPMENYKDAFAKIEKGTPGRMFLYPNAEDIKA